MQKRNLAFFQKLSARPARILWALFLGSVVVRFLLAVAFRSCPSISPDEALYLNIAKSLYARGEILLSGQPAKYAYLLYPFFLLPIYAFLPVEIDLFRAAQFVNVCLMSSAVFPAYYAAKEITGSHDRALLVAALTLLLPDMAMSAFLMSESLVYALFFTGFCVAVLAIKRGKIQYYALVGAIGALTYYTKNFHILFAVVFLALMLVANLLMKKPREALYALLGGAVLYGMCVGLMALSEQVFHLVAPTYNISTAGDIVGGLGAMLSDLGPYAEGFVMYAAFFTVALAGAYFVMPAFNLRAYTRDNRLIALLVGGAIVAVLMAVLYVIHPGTRGAPFLARVELRYFAMYAPPLIALSMAQELDGKRLNIFGAIWLLFTALYMVIFGLSSGFVLERAMVDNFFLAVFAPMTIGDTACRVISIVLAALLVLSALFLLKKGWTRFAKRVVLLFTVMLFLASNAAVYMLNLDYSNTGRSSDAHNAAHAIEEANGEALMLVTTMSTIDNQSVDSRSKAVLARVRYDEFMENLRSTDGVYVPFVPSAYPHSIPDRPLTDATLLILEAYTAPLFQFAPDVNLRKTPHSAFMLASIQKNQPVLVSMLGDPTPSSDHALPTESQKGSICVYDPDTLTEDGKIIVYFRVVSPEEGATITLDAWKGEASVRLNEGENMVSVSVAASEQFPKDILLYADVEGVVLREYKVLYE